MTEVSFAGNNEDTVTDLYDAQFREYGIQGRWPSPDPAANPANPQSWNRYAYALNNPLGLVDPSGFCTEELVQVGTRGDFPIFDVIYSPDCYFSTEPLIYGGAHGGGGGGGRYRNPAPQAPTSTCTINNGHVTGVATGAGQAPGAGAFGFVPPAGSVAIDPLSLGLFPGAQTNALLGPNASQITFSFSPVPNVPSGFPTTHTLGSILDPKARVGGVYFHGQYGFDIFGFSSVAAADAVTETGQVTITFPSSLPFNCGGPLVDPVPPNPGLASNQQPNTNGTLSAFQNVHFQRHPSSANHHALSWEGSSLRAQTRGNR